MALHKCNEIFNADCLEGMKSISDASVQLLIADLPYGSTNNPWDQPIPLAPLWEQTKRIIKPNGIVALTAMQPFTTDLVQSNRNWFRYSWVWEKANGTNFLNAKKQPLRCHEDVLIFAPGRSVYNPQMQPGKPYKTRRKATASTNYGECHKSSVTETDLRYPRSVLFFPHDPEKIHRTQKPVALFEYFVRTYTNPGDLVLDPCIGSGTTAIAAINTGRQYVGFELDPGYFQAAQERIARHKSVLAEIPNGQSWECAMRIDDERFAWDAEVERRYAKFRERMLTLLATERAA